jgi:hypothetical protein
VQCDTTLFATTCVDEYNTACKGKSLAPLTGGPEREFLRPSKIDISLLFFFERWDSALTAASASVCVVKIDSTALSIADAKNASLCD